jgi:glucokinase
MMPLILAGDVGGTHARLALIEIENGRLALATEATVPSRAHATLEEIVLTFLDEARRKPTHAAFGVAGPVRDGHVDATNLPWHVEARTLAARTGLREVTLINDLEANAYGVAALDVTDLVTLQEGQADPRGNAAVIAAGTGLGEAGLVWDGHRHRPFATEAGHADFAPTDDGQVELYRFLAREHGHVSVERVLSGPGLHNVYRFLRTRPGPQEPTWLTGALADAGAPAAISEAALAGRDPVCVEALDLFVRVFGAEAGNLALRTMATAGVYVGGGIAPKILAKLQEPAFLEAFRAKGRLRPLLARVPLRVIVNDRAALLGAARCAALRAGLIE